MKELSYNEFRSTFGEKMVDVTETAVPVLDKWPYVSLLVKNGIVLNYVFENEFVEKVYRNDQVTFDHVLLSTQNKNYFIVIVVDLVKKQITGHFCLDLEELYGIR